MLELGLFLIIMFGTVVTIDKLKTVWRRKNESAKVL